jgi:hypothetical protein
MRALASVLLVFAPTAIAQDVDEKPFDVEPLAPDPAREARVEELIGTLLSIDKPWHGISSTSGGGVAFDALDTDDITPTALTELPRAGPPVAFRQLVRVGPAAIPALLKHLDDKRETKLSLHWRADDGLGGMFEQLELFAGSPAERELIVRTLGAKSVKNDEPPRDIDTDEMIRDHTVTVGDCCFAILGQIVNRSYEAVRYQPTRITIVSSPTREPRIAEALRAMWGSGDPRQVLARSLQDDLVNQDPDAALRLLAYFPDEAAPVVAKRIAEFPWEQDRSPNRLLDYPGRYERGAALLRAAMSTGHALVRAEWLKLLDPARPAEAQLAALATSPSDPGEDVRERIRAIRDRPSDLDVVVACIAALPGERAPSTFAWLRTEFAKVEKRDAEETQAILAALAALDEGESLPIFLAHIEKLAEYGWGNILHALGKAPRPNLATALLRGLLDRTDVIVSRPKPAPAWLTFEMRWCDTAAVVLAAARPDLAFDAKAPVEERDRQIAAMRAALAE